MGEDCLSSQFPLAAIRAESQKKRAKGATDQLTQRLKRWNEPADGADGEINDIELHNEELGWEAWKLMQAFGWKFLPYEGGLMDQPETLMDDILAISSANEKVKEMLKG